MDHLIYGFTVSSYTGFPIEIHGDDISNSLTERLQWDEVSMRQAEPNLPIKSFSHLTK